jgi:hypothetical protein
MRLLRRHDGIGPLVVALVVYLGAVGYDGQFYYVLAESPTIDAHVQEVFEPFEYRVQRIAYPAMAWLLSGGGSKGGLPWALLAVNVFFALVATAATVAWMRARGWSGWLALAVGLTPGVLMTILRDLTDVVGLAAALGALWAWSERREWLTAGALALAVLARETMLILAAVLAYDAWRRRRRGEQAMHPAGLIGPALACFVAWEAYATSRFDGEIPWTTAPSNLWQAPGVGAVTALSGLLDQPASEAAWDTGIHRLVRGRSRSGGRSGASRPRPGSALLRGTGGHRGPARQGLLDRPLELHASNRAALRLPAPRGGERAKPAGDRYRLRYGRAHALDSGCSEYGGDLRCALGVGLGGLAGLELEAWAGQVRQCSGDRHEQARSKTDEPAVADVHLEVDPQDREAGRADHPAVEHDREREEADGGQCDAGRGRACEHACQHGQGNHDPEGSGHHYGDVGTLEPLEAGEGGQLCRRLEDAPKRIDRVPLEEHRPDQHDGRADGEQGPSALWLPRAHRARRARIVAFARARSRSISPRT